MSPCPHTMTRGRKGESGAWCVDCDTKVYEAETRECGNCAYFWKNDIGYSGCGKHLMPISSGHKVNYPISRGTCFEQSKLEGKE